MTLTPVAKVVLLLLLSNTFMTFAWYGHLKFLHGRPLLPVILISWGIALIEYAFAVPANRFGSVTLSGFQLKILQEAVTLIVFVVFARYVLGEKMRWNHGVCFVLLAAAAYFAFAFGDANGPLKEREGNRRRNWAPRRKAGGPDNRGLGGT